MAGEDVPESSRSRHRMDRNLLPRPRPRPLRIGTSAASPTTLAPNSNSNSNSTGGAAPPDEAAPVAPAAVAADEPECVCNSRFECYICLAVAKEPVVTTCGHLFCWPCLYRWILPQSPFCECPVCKGELLKGNITPIYGRGSDEGEENAAAAAGGFPPRPRANRRAIVTRRMQADGYSGNIRQLESMVRGLIQNPAGMVGGLPPPAPAPAGAEVVASVPQQPSSSSVEQPSTSRAAAAAAAAAADEPGPSRSGRTRRMPSRYRE